MKPVDDYPKREPNTNVWYRNDTFPENHREPAKVTRFVEDIVPNWGEYWKTQPQYDDNSENYTPKAEGIMKFDTSNPIWTFADEEIKEAIKDKVTEMYMFVDPSDVEVDISRDKKTISYRTKKKMMSFWLESETGRGGESQVVVNFEFLDDGETFSIDPNVMKSKYGDIWDAWNLMKKGIMQDITREDKWIKTSPYTFCIYDEKGKITKDCLKTEFGFQALKNGAKFNVNMDKIKEESPTAFATMVKQIAEVETDRRVTDIENSLNNNTVFIKIDENTFALGTNKDITFDVEDPNSLPVFFQVWQVLVEEKAIPEGTVPLSDIGVGEVFVVPDAYIPKLLRKKIIPMNSQFIKLSDEEFINYKPGKAMPDEEELEKFKKKKKQEIFHIADPSLPDYDTDWDRRIISPNIQVVRETGEAEKPKKKETLDGIFDEMFKQYEVKKSDIGEYIVVNMEAISKAVGKAGADFQEFANNTESKESEWVNPETEEEEMVKFGNSERHAWIVRTLEDGGTEVIITKA